MIVNGFSERCTTVASAIAVDKEIASKIGKAQELSGVAI
jgi:hypothetical protein